MGNISLQTSSQMSEHAENGLRILKSKTDHQAAVLYFHGFPGPFDQLPPGELRIADQIFDDVVQKYDYYYPLYTLKKEDFSYEQTIHDGMIAVKFLLAQKSYTEILLVGQSWGAVIALELARTFKFNKVVLITPFLFVPTGVAAQKTVDYYKANHPGLLSNENAGVYVEQIEQIAATVNPESNFLALSVESVVFACDADEVVDFKRLQTVVAKNPSSKLVSLPNQTHKVENRVLIRDLIRKEL